ncbi:MAG: heavy-metal-associated domain-containing protein [Gaiellaceae bacterium]
MALGRLAPFDGCGRRRTSGDTHEGYDGSDLHTEMNMNETKTYSVPGMHCGHCKAAVTEELSGVGGVERVAVDLDSKLVTVVGSGLENGALRAAIGEAGYEAEEVAV